MSETLNVDEIAPLTPEILEVARHRTHDIIREWARQLSVWGTTELHGPDGPKSEVPTLAHLVMAAYSQGVRDTAAVAATKAPRFTEEERAALGIAMVELEGMAGVAALEHRDIASAKYGNASRILERMLSEETK